MAICNPSAALPLLSNFLGCCSGKNTSEIYKYKAKVSSITQTTNCKQQVQQKKRQSSARDIPNLTTTKQSVKTSTMKVQKLITLVIVAGLLILPSTLARRSSSTSTDTATADSNGVTTPACIISIVNAIIMNVNNIVDTTATGLSVCPPVCATGAVQCAGCILGIINIPMLPSAESLPGCT